MTYYALRELTKVLRRVSKDVITNDYHHIAKPDYKLKGEWPERKIHLKFIAREEKVKGKKGTKSWGSHELIIVAKGNTFDQLDPSKGYDLRNIRTIIKNSHIPGFGDEILPRALRPDFDHYRKMMRNADYKGFISSVSNTVEGLLDEIKLDYIHNQELISPSPSSSQVSNIDSKILYDPDYSIDQLIATRFG